MRTAGPLLPLLGGLLCSIVQVPAAAGDIVLHEHRAAGSGAADGAWQPVEGLAVLGHPRSEGGDELPAALPAVTLSLYQAVDERWALLASAGWQDWSNLRPPAAGHPLRAVDRDAWHLGLGTQYRAAPDLLWRAGVSYDSSPLAAGERAFAMPATTAWSLAAGFSYALEPDAQLNVNYSYVRLGDMPAQQDLSRGDGIGEAGEFSNAGIHVVSLSLVWWY